MIRLMVEVAVPPGHASTTLPAIQDGLEQAGFQSDPELEPVPMGGEGGPESRETYVLSGSVSSAEKLRALEARPEVVKVWGDARVEPFQP